MRFAAFWIRKASLAVMLSSEAPGPTRAAELAAVRALFAATPNRPSETEFSREAEGNVAGEPRGDDDATSCVDKPEDASYV